jgi:hypothetical protein
MTFAALPRILSGSDLGRIVSTPAVVMGVPSSGSTDQKGTP